MNTRDHNLSVFILTVWCFGFACPTTGCSFTPSAASLSCSDQSVIRQNMFGHLPDLQKLQIEMSSDLDIQRGAFQGLEKLKTLKVLSWQKLLLSKLFSSEFYPHHLKTLFTLLVLLAQTALRAFLSKIIIKQA